MRQFVLRNIPVNVRTVLFTFCAGSALSQPLILLLRIELEWPGWWPESWDKSIPAGIFQLGVMAGIAALPFVSLTLVRISPPLLVLGLLLFFLMCWSLNFLP